MSPTNDQLVTVLIGGGALLGIVASFLGVVLLSKKIFWPRIERDNEFVTKAELASSLAQMDQQTSTSLTQMEQKISEFKIDLIDRVQRLDQYAHQSAHSTASGMQSILLKLQTLIVLDETRSGRKFPSTGSAMESDEGN
jgi:Tfp pilus assembly protein PilN